MHGFERLLQDSGCRAQLAVWIVLFALVLPLSSAAEPRASAASEVEFASEFAFEFAFEFDLDLAKNSLRVRERRTAGPAPSADEWAAEFRVAVGSPAHPTPRGSFALGRVILRPAWTPGAAALAAGAEAAEASLASPMGVAKIPFAEGGEIALHGGGDPDVLGKPVSSGCVRASDADLLRLIAWLHLHGALASAVETQNGEWERGFQRPARLRIH